MSGLASREAVEPLLVSASGDRLALGGLDQVVGLRLRMAHAASQRTFMEMLAPLELTQKQVAVLWLIDANPAVSQIQLATTLGMDRATMMAIVDRLDGRNLLARRRSKADRRRQELQLTEAGRALLVRAKALIGAHEETLKARIGARELAAFTAALRRVAG
jgi:DNA-binding MarR family transcriptional regulator